MHSRFAIKFSLHVGTVSFHVEPHRTHVPPHEITCTRVYVTYFTQLRNSAIEIMYEEVSVKTDLTATGGQ